MRTKDVRIMLLVGSDGKVSCCIEGDCGWGDLADGIATWDQTKRELIDPATSARYIVTTTVKLPVISKVAGRAALSEERAGE